MEGALRGLLTLNVSPILTTRALGWGRTVCHLLSANTSSPPTWSWWSMVIEVGSQCGPVPSTSPGCLQHG